VREHGLIPAEAGDVCLFQSDHIGSEANPTTSSMRMGNCLCESKESGMVQVTTHC
jgi:hypothetical protein